MHDKLWRLTAGMTVQSMDLGLRKTCIRKSTQCHLPGKMTKKNDDLPLLRLSLLVCILRESVLPDLQD